MIRIATLSSKCRKYQAFTMSLEVSLRIRISYTLQLSMDWETMDFYFSFCREQAGKKLPYEGLHSISKERRKGLSRTWRLGEELLNSPSVLFSVLRRDAPSCSADETCRIEQRWISRMDSTIHIHVMETFWVLLALVPLSVFLILMQNGNPPPYFY